MAVKSLKWVSLNQDLAASIKYTPYFKDLT